MANLQDTTNSVLNNIKTIQSALEFKNVDLNGTTINLSDLLKLDVMNFIIDFFKQTKGYDFLVESLSDFIVDYLPYIEYSMKVILLGYLETMLSCSVKPIITKKMILDGVYFDLQSIDLFNLLQNEPVINRLNDNDSVKDYMNDNKPGKYLYFGCSEADGINTFQDLYKCRDFNAFLWAAKNAPGTRMVWKRESDLYRSPIIYELPELAKIYKVDHTFEFPKNSGNFITVKKFCYKKKDKDGGNEKYYTLSNEEVKSENGFGPVAEVEQKQFAKQGKRNGICTIEYNTKSSSLSNAEHSKMDVTEPIQNCLHVFMGCCDEINPEKGSLNTIMRDTKSKINSLKEFKKDLNYLIKELKDVIIEYENDDLDANIDIIKQCKDDISKIKQLLATLPIQTGKTIKQKTTEIFNVVNNFIIIEGLEGRMLHGIYIPSDIIDEDQTDLENSVRTTKQTYTKTGYGEYPNAGSNYYYLHPLLEFNTDLIFSMPWFESKVVAAQLIDRLIGCLTLFNDLFNGDLSLQSQIIKSELEGMIEKVIENDDDTVSDCFFTFDNDKFNSFLQSYEMKRIGLYTIDGENAITPPLPSDIMSEINNLSPNATKEEMMTAIEHSLTSAIGYVNGNSDSIDVSFNGGFNFNTNVNVFDRLIKQLMYIIVSTFLTPKIYMILMFNLKLLEQNEGMFDLKQFIKYCKSMFIDMIKSIKQQIIDYLKELMMKILNEMLALYKPIMIQEQYLYYKELLSKCIECIQIHGNEYDWAQDVVNYADITDPITSTNDEC